jgi:uncharacterized protein with HEPN domain
LRNGEAVVLLHIRDALARIIEYAEVGEAEFMGDVRTQDAILRRLEIVGEAVKRLPQAFRDAHPAIPWKRIAGFRDVAIHHYDRVDLDRVWMLAQRDAPVLLDQVKELLAELGETR